MKSPKSRSTEEQPGPKPKAGGKSGVVLLAGGNPQIAKADGDAPVQAYIAAMPGWKSDLGKRLDALIVRHCRRKGLTHCAKFVTVCAN